MIAEFERYIKEKVKLSEEDLELIRSVAVEKIVRRKQFLLQQGEVCRYKIFICKGLLRTYRTREDGSEHVMMFSPETWWATDPESLNNQTPSLYYIDALEDSEVLLWTKNDFAMLCSKIPELKSYSEKLISTNLNIGRQRIFSALSSTAEEKYDEFVASYPNIFARIPLHMVASYLGVSLKTLSRIRQAQLKR
ncbi:MAG: Crp/Fnr family transcriptional regulator [Bacteroidota bacterium]